MVGTISTTITNSYTLKYAQTTITNTGKVLSGNTANCAIYNYGTTFRTLTNFGSIISTGFGAGVIEQTGIVLNEAGALISDTGSGYGVSLSGYLHSHPPTILQHPTLINAGTISSSGNGFGSGVGVATNGYILNQQSGTISGALNGVTFGDYPISNSIFSSGTVVNDGTIFSKGGLSGIAFLKGISGTVVNSGLITNLLSGGNYGGAYGVLLTEGGVITNTGTIIGNRDGLYFKIGGTAHSAAVTVINAGTIIGGQGPSYAAIAFEKTQTNLLVVDPGAVFIGAVKGGTPATSSLELASGASTGTLSGLGSQFTNFGTLTFDPSAKWLVSANSAGITSTIIDGFGAGDTIEITGFTATSQTTLAGNTGLVLTNSVGAHETLSFGASVSSFGVTSGTFGTDITTLCFLRGTVIDTPTGQVHVEKLAVGDTVRSLGNGGTRTVTWIGVGKLLATPGKRTAATPVIVRKDALADNIPSRDLHVTKSHSLFIDGVLIPVEFLVNHKTIIWDDRAKEVDIRHVELDGHDVLLANGAPAESYRDDGNRWLFRNANQGWHLPPQDLYAPVLTGGPIVDAVWTRLLRRAEPRDLPPMTDDPDLHLIVDDKRVDIAQRFGQVRVFRLPCRPEKVAIASREVVPAEFGFARDPRSLGVALRRIVVRQGATTETLLADDVRLTDGFHGYEATDDLRWTNGRASLPRQLLARLARGEVEIELTLAGATQYPNYGEILFRAA
jgi:hypothetical protein